MHVQHIGHASYIFIRQQSRLYGVSACTGQIEIPRQSFHVSQVDVGQSHLECMYLGGFALAPWQSVVTSLMTSIRKTWLPADHYKNTNSELWQAILAHDFDMSSKIFDFQGSKLVVLCISSQQISQVSFVLDN